MKLEEYRAKRTKLLEQAQAMLDNGEIHNNKTKFDDLKKEVEQLDLENNKTPLEQANERALGNNPFINSVLENNDNKKFTTIASTTMDSNKEFIREENKEMKLFLNKADKLVDRVDIKDEKVRELLNKEGSLGEVIKGMVTGKWDNTELKNVVTTTATGVLIPQILSAQVIDLAREQSLFTSSGVRILPMTSNNMTISRVKTDPVLEFKKEGLAGTSESSFEIEGIELKSKTAYGYAYVSLESILSSQNLDGIIRQVFAQAMANTIDKAFLYGQYNITDSEFDDFAPIGIMNDPNIKSVTAALGGGYDDIIKAIGKVRQSKGTPTAYAINAETEELLSLLKTSALGYMEPPVSVSALQKIVSNQLKYDVTAGSDALIFDPASMVIGIQNDIQIKIIEDSECLKKGLVGFQIYSMLDCRAVQPTHICKVSGIKPTPQG